MLLCQGWTVVLSQEVVSKFSSRRRNLKVNLKDCSIPALRLDFMTMKVMKYIVLPTRNATKKGYVRTMAEDLTQRQNNSGIKQGIERVEKLLDWSRQKYSLGWWWGRWWRRMWTMKDIAMQFQSQRRHLAKRGRFGKNFLMRKIPIQPLLHSFSFGHEL